MASPAAKSIGFQDAFTQAFRGITTKSDTWNSDLKTLTEETKKMMESSEKSQEVKTILFDSISTLNGKNLDEAKAKLVLKSVYLGLPASVSGGEFPIMQALKKPMADAIAGLKEKAESIFAKSAPRISPRSGPSKNMDILASIAAQQQARSEESTAAAARIHSALKTQSPTALIFTKEVAGEIKLKFAAPIHQKAIENIELLAKEVEKLNQAASPSASDDDVDLLTKGIGRLGVGGSDNSVDLLTERVAGLKTATPKETSKALTYQDLQQLLNQARGRMQTAQDIILELAQYDELETLALKKKVQELKTGLAEKVELLSKQMDDLISSEKCDAAMAPLMAPEAKKDMDQFNKTVDLYIQTGTRAVALVNVEKNIQEAEVALQKAEAQEKTPDLTETEKTIKTSSKALSMTSTALEVFAEAKAACAKFTNPLLDKLRNAQKNIDRANKKSCRKSRKAEKSCQRCCQSCGKPSH